MENFLAILTKPDNIPIAIMLPLVIYYCWLALSQARKHDELIEQGKKNEVYDRMIR